MRHIIQNAKFKTHDTKKAPGTLIPTQPNSALKTQYTKSTNIAHCTNRCTTLYISVQHCVCHSSCGWLLGPPSPPGHRQSPPPGSERPWIRPVFCHHRSILHCVTLTVHCTAQSPTNHFAWCMTHCINCTPHVVLVTKNHNCMLQLWETRSQPYWRNLTLTTLTQFLFQKELNWDWIKHFSAVADANRYWGWSHFCLMSCDNAL